MNGDIFTSEIWSVIPYVLFFAAIGLIAAGLTLAIRNKNKIWHIMTIAGGAAFVVCVVISCFFIFSRAASFLGSYYGSNTADDEYVSSMPSYTQSEIAEISGVYIVGDMYPVVFTADHVNNDVYMLDAATKESLCVFECSYYSSGNIPRNAGFDYIHVTDHNSDSFNDIIITLDNGDSVVFLYDYYYDYFFEMSELYGY